MSQIFRDIKIGLDEDLEEKIAWLMPEYSSYHILRESVDARRRHHPHLVYSFEVFGKNETPPAEEFKVQPIKYSGPPVLIVGAGPAGLFAALRLCERGIPCHLFEQGSESAKRMQGITRYWRYGELDPLNNVCFGEGGAGLYSDGKLITRIKSAYIPYVMHRLVRHGAPAEIQYLANPHVGSDRIRRVIPKLRKSILDLGGKIHFDTPIVEVLTQGKQVTGLKTATGEVFKSDHVILACGHSAGEVFTHLNDIGVFMEGKSFAVGLRIEHEQKLINNIQYRGAQEHPKLGAANYKLTHYDPSDKTGVYSFCMCPGGYVLSSGTESDSVVCNGMSNYNRNSAYANAAIVVSVDFEKSFGTSDIFAGLKFRRELEVNAMQMVEANGGKKELPAQRLTDFLEGKSSTLGKNSSLSGALPARLDQLLPKTLQHYFIKALQGFEEKMQGFLSSDAHLFGVESRTSCPLRITRDPQSLQSVSHKGLYPTGEGAGYAGGITSAACDGIKAAEAIAALYDSSIEVDGVKTRSTPPT